MAHIPKKSKPKLGMFFGVNVFVGFLAAISCVLVYKDNRNAQLGLEEWQTLKFHKQYFEVGAYPMGGMLTSLAGASLDAMTIFIFLFGFFCSCIYYRHYVRVTLISLLVTITAAVVLFCTEYRASDYLGRYFKIVMEFEYKNTETSDRNSAQMFVDNIQNQMECCGYNGPQDWKTSAWLPAVLRELMLPKSCCKFSSNQTRSWSPSATASCSILDDYHKVGCSNLLYKYAGRWRNAAKYCLLLKIISLIVCILLGTQLYKEHVLETERRQLLANRRTLAARRLSETAQQLQRRESHLVTIHESDGQSVKKTIRDCLPQYRFRKISNFNNKVELVSGTI